MCEFITSSSDLILAEDAVKEFAYVFAQNEVKSCRWSKSIVLFSSMNEWCSDTNYQLQFGLVLCEDYLIGLDSYDQRLVTLCSVSCNVSCNLSRGWNLCGFHWLFNSNIARQVARGMLHCAIARKCVAAIVARKSRA